MKDLGLLIIRLGIGAMFIYHGWDKLFGGVEKWTQLGGVMATFGISIFPTFWGFMAAVAEVFGGLFLGLGLLQRQFATPMLAFTMLVAAVMHLKQDGLGEASHAIEALFVFVGLWFTGAGKYSLDEKFNLHNLFIKR